MVTADIPIVDDEINEAEEEFVVVLEVFSNTTNQVEFTTQTTVCRIPQSDRKHHKKCSTFILIVCMQLNNLGKACSKLDPPINSQK